jgi:hypothetical protein
MIEFRDLTPEDIEVRMQSIKKQYVNGQWVNGVILLLYKNARVDMNILDETVGTENWQREHYECKGNLFCRVGINANYKTANSQPNWVYKSDCGTESNTEAQKGEASDSFKRACFNWGIGRELYTSPYIWVSDALCNIYDTGRKDKYNNAIFKCNDKFAVGKIKIENKQITGLSINNLNNGKRVFLMIPEQQSEGKN